MQKNDWTARRILRELCNSDARRLILVTFWKKGDDMSRRLAIAQLAKAIHFREGSLKKLPAEKKANLLASRVGAADFEEIFEAALLRKKQRGANEELEKVVENKAIQEIAHLESGLWILALISNVAPILGFLGTVVGMINSFDVLAKEGMNNPGAVAEGISQALITTAGGLVVAVAVLPFYNWFTTRIGAFVNEIETATNFLFETLDEMGQKAR